MEAFRAHIYSFVPPYWKRKMQKIILMMCRARKSSAFLFPPIDFIFIILFIAQEAAKAKEEKKQKD